jgi:hypothetical protein
MTNNPLIQIPQTQHATPTTVASARLAFENRTESHPAHHNTILNNGEQERSYQGETDRHETTKATTRSASRQLSGKLSHFHQNTRSQPSLGATCRIERRIQAEKGKAKARKGTAGLVRYRQRSAGFGCYQICRQTETELSR